MNSCEQIYATESRLEYDTRISPYSACIFEVLLQYSLYEHEYINQKHALAAEKKEKENNTKTLFADGIS